MRAMTLILNILWFILGGFVAGLWWLACGLILAITIVGLPWAQAAWRIGGFSFAPFGKRVVGREEITGREDLGTGSVGFLLNVIWFLLAGWHLALMHLVIGALQCASVIGIPFGLQHFKLAIIALAPIGKEVVEA
jgi:uncharacterized membrane protein YccF (DUF307 family)